MKIILFLPLVVLLAGCMRVDQVIDTTTALTAQKKEDKNFHTDLQRFEDELNSVKTKEQRDRLVDQLITASNMECNTYLYKTAGEPEEETDGVYTYMFKTVGKYIGWDIAKDAIDAVSAISDVGEKKRNQDKYTQALKPNIIKAVQIARKKYLQKIQTHKQLGLQEYPVAKVKEDLEAYDKRCSTYYGLMEITNALEKQQDQSDQKAKSIDINEVKSKIKEVTKEVQNLEKGELTPP
jgi:hypothetical protein